MVVVNGANFLEDAMGLDGEARPEVPVMNRYVLEGLGRIGFDALNAGTPDLSGLTGLGGSGVGLPVVSANAHGPGILPSRIVDAGNLRVAVTGIGIDLDPKRSRNQKSKKQPASPHPGTELAVISVMHFAPSEDGRLIEWGEIYILGLQDCVVSPLVVARTGPKPFRDPAKQNLPGK